jgi:uncharacterized protein YijF (DUF1287 family)
MESKESPPKIENSKTSIPTVSVPITASPEALKFLEAAKLQIGVVKTYDFSNGYYSGGGAPPPDTGVCTDVIWRAYRDIGHDLPKLVQEAAKKNPKAYESDLDANINYRRVKRLQTYFTKNSHSYPLELIPGDEKNLVGWQPGDIVIFEELPTSHLWHIGIVSDEKRPDGVPYLIDNHGEGVSITITPLDWPTKVVGHFRVF